MKPHADYLPGTMEVLQEICNRFPRFNLIDPSTTWHQLKTEGISTVLTCYGSIGHELPLLGFKVINAAYNPHIAYSFNVHSKTIEEYDDIILNKINAPLHVNADEVYEFFYVQNAITQPDDAFFDSASAFLSKVKSGEAGVTEYEIYMAQFHQFNQRVKNYFYQLHQEGKDFIYER